MDPSLPAEVGSIEFLHELEKSAHTSAASLFGQSSGVEFMMTGAKGLLSETGLRRYASALADLTAQGGEAGGVYTLRSGGGSRLDLAGAPDLGEFMNHYFGKAKADPIREPASGAGPVASWSPDRLKSELGTEELGLFERVTHRYFALFKEQLRVR
jgi:hypothetical protein